MHDAADAPRSTDETTGLTRRALTRSAAWSVPAIAVAATAPAVAASAELPTVEFQLSVFCNTGFHLDYRFSSQQPIPVGAQLAFSVTSDVPGSLFGSLTGIPHDPTQTPYVLTGAGAPRSHSGDVYSPLPDDTEAQITFTLTAISGLQLGGSTSVVARMRRDASGSYECLAPGNST
ncbi:hypothetical protein [Agromyces sp. SYSU T00194]|uniref:hypothetical protein n=1 Tax=Agromyces chitinivorans TaxID=3158560 RepID=UPI0033978CAC